MGKRSSRWRRGLKCGALGLALVIAVFVALGWTAFGKAASGARLARMQASTQWDGDGFENPLPLYNDVWGWLPAALEGSDHAAPDEPLPVVRTDPALLERAPHSGLRITWLGHSTTLIEIDGRRLLTDPVWGPRSSPYSFVGPERWYPPPLALEALPRVDAVLISHDHYDHLDEPTIVQLRDRNTIFVAPLGVGAHLEYWGVPAERIVELDWWERTKVSGMEIVCTPARHASGRQLFDQNATLWAGYALLGEAHRVFFSGDTGMFPELADIGERFGPFDLTLIEVGAYHRTWPDWHMGPEQAVEAHKMLRGKSLLPIHWGLFDLALHGWTEPIERTLVAADAAGVRVLTPRPGESLEPESAKVARWWPEVPWQTAAEHPIKATGIFAASAAR